MNSIVTGGLYSDYSSNTTEVAGISDVLVVHEEDPKWQIFVRDVDDKDGTKYMKNKVLIEFKSLIIK